MGVLEVLSYLFRPLDAWPGQKSKWHGSSKFKAGWSATLDLLERELRHLNAKDVVLQVAVGLEKIRNDGGLKADARPSWPGVILSFSSKHGDLQYPCDKFNDWQDNVRAIALSLEALRRVDRYGVTRRAEQYTGWARLENKGAIEADEAAVILGAAAGDPAKVTRSNVDFIYRSACAKAHPDVGGSPEAFKRVQAAKEILDKHFASGA